MKKIFGIVLGAMLIAGSVLAILNITNIVPIDISLDGWWSLFIIVPAVNGLISDKGNDKVWNVFFLLLGIYLLCAARGLIGYELGWELAVPTIIALLGIRLIIKTVKSNNKTTAEANTTNSDECMAVFSGKTVDYSGMDIELAKIGAIFGGANCNLSDAHFTDKSRVNVFCMFGGADIIVPENVEIKINAFCLFGGISDKRDASDFVPKTAQLTINGFCMFGGADIK